MEKINFEDLPSTNTPINATNLNQLQTNVENEFNENKAGEWKTPTFVTGYSSGSGIPFQVKKVGQIVLINGVITTTSTTFSSTNTKVCNIGYNLDRTLLINAYISGDEWSQNSSGGLMSGYVNASGDLFLRNVLNYTAKYVRINAILPIA